MKKFFVVIVCMLFMLQGCTSASTNIENSVIEKTDDIFDTSYVHQINIEISNEDWEDLKANPLDKTKYKVNVTIDGNQVNGVSFATKGNTSLSSVAADSNSDRYSFKINFGKYDKSQTYQGIKKLNLSNIYSDATYMKDYLSYQMFNEAGALSSRCSYVWLTVNGEDFGLYLAIEEVDQAFLDVNTDSEGELYKPESEMLGNIGDGKKQDDNKQPEEGNNWQPGDGNFGIPGGMDMPEGFDPFNQGDGNGQGGFNPGNMTPPNGDNPFSGEGGNGQGGFNPGNMPGSMGGFGSSNSASLVYTDDQLSSYSEIFDNAETDVTEEDEYRVIEALKNLSEGNIEESVDVDNTIRYFVVHNFVMNYDSYTGNMLHNYYLYENDGLLTMIPWDYNLAFGAFAMGAANDATSLINQGIDSPLSGAGESDRPMWSWIVSSEEYTEQYHAVYQQFITEYFDSGKFEKEFDRVVNMIREYVEKDPSSFYSVSQFDTATARLKQFCLLRAESIRKQLNGELATVTSQQNSADKVDASGLNISSMGSFGGGGNGGGNGFNPGNFFGGGNGFDPGDFSGGNGGFNPWGSSDGGFNPGDSSGNGFGPGGFSGGNDSSNPWGSSDGGFNPGDSSGNGSNPGCFSGGDGGFNPWDSSNGGFNPGDSLGNGFNPGNGNGFGPGDSSGEDNGNSEGGGSQEPVGEPGDIEEL